MPSILKTPTLAAMALLLFTAAASSSGAEFKALTKKIVRTRCHIGYCSWSRIDTARSLGASATGELLELSLTEWRSHHMDGDYDKPARRTDEKKATTFVFCSKTKPALIERENEGTQKWVATFIAPGSSEAVFGATESAYALYWAACHAVEARDVYEEQDDLGRRFGYRLSLSDKGFPEDEILSDPREALKW
jgi:hypothetical protein